MDSTTRQEFEKMTYVASTVAPGPVQMLVGIIKLLEILLGWLSITGEIFLRYKFGSRYLSPLRLLIAWWVFQTYRSLYFFIGALLGFTKQTSLYDWFFNRYDYSNLFNNDASSFIYVLFVYATVGFTGLHLLAIWKREQDGEVWHSKSFGASWMEFLPWGIWHWLISFIPVPALRKGLTVDDWTLMRFVEPWLCFQIAQWLKTYDDFLGSWLLIVAITLMIKNNLLYLEMKGRILDTVDAQIESKFIQASLNGMNKQKTAGFSVVPVPSKFTAEEMDIVTTVQATLQPRSDISDSVIATAHPHDGRS